MKSDDLNDKTETAHRLLARYRTDGRQLFERATISTGPDGYPRQASGADPTIPSDAPVAPHVASEHLPSGDWTWKCSCGLTGPRFPTEAAALGWGGKHLDEFHADGRAISYSDPTGDSVTGRRDRDPVRAEAYRAMKHLDKALEHLEAGAAIFDYQKHLLGLATPAGDEDRWCQSCRRDGGYPQQVQAGRYARYCSWCGPFYAKYRQEPPLQLLEMLHSGKRIYDRDITQALKAPKGRKAG